jgi:hypothetical protein
MPSKLSFYPAWNRKNDIFVCTPALVATGVDAINRDISGDSLAVSLVAGVELREGETDVDVSNDLILRTYKIKPGPPKGHSYAKGIAVRYGISFEQLARQWQERLEPSMKK